MKVRTKITLLLAGVLRRWVSQPLERISRRLEGEDPGELAESVKDRADQKIQRNYHLQQTINRMLAISFKSLPLPEILTQCLAQIISVPWAGLRESGMVLLRRGEAEELVMEACQGIHASLTGSCQRVPFGQFICGQAAAGGEVVFGRCQDHAPETQWDQMSPHSHCGVPLKSAERTLGALCLELRENHRRDEEDFGLLQALANVLSGIIQRKQGEKALRESELQYKNLVDNLPQKVFFKDQDSVWVACNENMARDLGLKPEEIFGKTDFDLFPRELAEKYRADDRRIMASGKTEELDESYVQAGQPRIVHTVKTPLRDELGHPQGILGIFWDITEKQQAEEARRRAEKELDRLFEVAPDLICICGFDGYFKRINPAWETTLGRSMAELLAKPFLEFIHPEDRAATVAEVDKIGQGVKTLHFENRYQRQDGSYRRLSWATIPALEEGLIYCVAHDVTEQKRAEEEIQRNYNVQHVIARLLSLSLENFSLEAILSQALKLITSIPWLKVEEKGAIFLAKGDPPTLVMQTHYGLSPAVLDCCEEVPFGKCVCGRAAVGGEIIFEESSDEERHECQYEGMTPHGHYCVPIKSAGRTLGVMCLYLGAGHGREAKEEEFLAAFTNALAGVVQRKQAEDQLNMLGRAVEQSIDGIAVADLAGYIIFANRAWAAMHGYAREEVLNQHLAMFHTPEQIEREVAPFNNEVLAQGAEFGEVGHKRKDGTVFPTLMAATLLKDEKGDPVGWVGIVRDITEQKRAEQAMREAEARYRSLFDNSRDAIYVHDFQGRFVDANQAALQLFGYGKEEINQLSLADLLAPDQLPLARQTLEELKANGNQINLTEFKTRTKDGCLVEIETMATVIYEAGRPQYIQGLARDITERKALIQRLEALSRDLESEHSKLRSIIDHVDASVMLVDERAIVRDCNPHYERLIQKNRAEIIGHPIFDFVQEEYRDFVRQDISAFQAGDRAVRSVNHRLGGRPHNVRIAPITGPHGSLRGLIVHMVDITDLMEAQAAAEAANRAKSNFLANMSHEIRTPMNGILGFAELLQNTSLTAKQKRYLETIQLSGQHLLTLINQILDLSRIEAGKVQLQPAPFSPRRLGQEALEMVRPIAQRKGLQLTLDVQAPERVAADEKRLLQVMVNLLGNAAKFTEQGRIALNITWEGPNLLVLAVKDTGPGVAPEQQARVFEAFEQVQAGLSRNFEGSGLGLAISAKLIELMGGKIQLESVAGQGSMFTVRLPVEVCESSGPAVSETRDLSASPPRETRPRTVLIVDDEPEIREVCARMLEHLGYLGVTASSVAEGLDKVREARPDAIILDLNLPERSGWDFLAEMKNSREFANIPVIIATVLDESEKGKALGAGGWMTKPYTLLTLARNLEQALQTRNQPAVPEPAPLPVIAKEAPPPSARKKILVMEDNPINREVVKEFLQDTGWSILEAENGQIGLDLMRMERPDLVLMDLAMPVMDGMTAVREIRRDPALKNIPVIAVTAAAMSGDREKCLAAGYNDYISKPYQMETLVSTIKKYLTTAEAENENHG